MRVSKFYPGFLCVMVLAVAACGGGGSSSPTPSGTTAATTQPTMGATATPMAAATAGPMTMSYSSTFGANQSTLTSAPPPIAFLAETETVSVTASQSNNTGGYTAAANGACGSNVTVAPLTSATGSFTITAVTPVAIAAGCQVTFSGTAGSAAVAVGASVTAPGGVMLNWVANAAYATLPAPINPIPGPINLIGTTSLFQAILVVSETHYLGTFQTPVLTGAGCAGNITTPLATIAQGNIAGPQASLAQTQAYYVVVAPATATAIASGTCSITVTDNAPTPNTSAAMGVILTITGGSIN